MADTFRKIAERIRAEYTIGFYPITGSGEGRSPPRLAFVAGRDFRSARSTNHAPLRVLCSSGPVAQCHAGKDRPRGKMGQDLHCARHACYTLLQ